MQRIIKGETLGHVSELAFRDPNYFRAGELHSHVEQWEKKVGETPDVKQVQVLRWIRDKVSVPEFFRPFRGKFK